MDTWNTAFGFIQMPAIDLPDNIVPSKQKPNRENLHSAPLYNLQNCLNSKWN